MESLYVAIEGGGSKTRMLLADAEGRVLAREIGGPASPLYIDPEAYAREAAGLLRRIKDAAARHGGRVVRVGFGGPMNHGIVASVVKKTFGSVACILVGESEIAFALYDLECGVSLVGGTGASCRAKNEAGDAVSCGGFGPQFGDEGSGYWIGRAGIAAAMRAEDDRATPTSLAQRICAFYAIPRVHDILGLMDRGGHVSGTKVAAFAPEVFAAAFSGDAAALNICREAGLELGRLIAATANRLSWARQPVPVVCTGGLFNAGSLIMISLGTALRRNRLTFNIHTPAPDPTEGIIKILLAQRGQKRG